MPFASLFRLADNRPNLSEAVPAAGTLVTVVIPARNESATIATVVGSVRASTYQPLEIVVVDDRSTDDTAAIVERIASRCRKDGTGSRGLASRDIARRAATSSSSPTRTPGTSRSFSRARSAPCGPSGPIW